MRHGSEVNDDTTLAHKTTDEIREAEERRCVMFLCVNGHEFEQGKPSHTLSMNPDSAHCCPVEYKCPECGTCDYGEAIVCQACGKYELKEYIQKCKNCGNEMCEDCKEVNDFCGIDCWREHEEAEQKKGGK
jgi:hypothetical protein